MDDHEIHQSHAHEAAELFGLILAQLLMLLMFSWGMVWYFRAPLVPAFVSIIVVSSVGDSNSYVYCNVPITRHYMMLCVWEGAL
jgi:hypothetical protein